ncbi:hypothetical protein [Lactococcus lactis]|uniref:hypothetical protein n=1 Tax=Lactococcus lactis TaxID=1358 RepID=UPI0022E4AA56|nr:hypothetical protein [Lactococcus lactis]
MKLNEIKAHVYLKKAVEPKLARVFQEPEKIKFIDYPVYTAEQMQEYAKAKVLETVELYAKDGSTVPVDSIKEFVLKIIFEEDTKNE